MVSGRPNPSLCVDVKRCVLMLWHDYITELAAKGIVPVSWGLSVHRVYIFAFVSGSAQSRADQY
jgi:hypothetical protein